jgi:hypothetical protein
MAMRFEELDEKTRTYMLREFEAEEASGKPYRGQNLSMQGLEVFPRFMREAIVQGNEQTLTSALNNPQYWHTYKKSGKPVKPEDEAERLGLTEFNTWYVRGLSKRLMDEGVKECQAYRAALPKHQPSRCPLQEGQIYPLDLVYKGHRAKYWPPPGNLAAFSIPDGPNCHHTIRRTPITGQLPSNTLSTNALGPTSEC